MLAAFTLPHLHMCAKTIDSPSSKCAYRLPDGRNDSVLPQYSTGLEAAGDDGSSVSCAERRAEDARCHCRKSLSIRQRPVCIFLFAAWVANSDVDV